MRVLFISNFYPPYDLGGWEQNCQEVVEHLQARGHACHVLTSRFGTNSSSLTEVQVTRALYLQADIYRYRPQSYFLRRSAEDQANRAALRQALDEFRPDLVFIWGLWNISFGVAYWAEQWMRGRVVYAVAGYWFLKPNPHEAYWAYPARRRLISLLMAPARGLALRQLSRERAAYRLRLEHVACVSRYVLRKLTDAGALPCGGRVIYNGIDPQPFLRAAALREPKPNRLRLVYTGGLVEHKGVHLAVEAMGIMRMRGELSGLHLDLVGSGHPDYEARLVRLVSELGLQEHVRFCGRVSRDQIPNVLAEHDVFLFTSTYEEPIARSVMEAMASGLSVIATNVGGQAEMLDDESNSLVYPPGEASALADCICRLRSDPDLRARLSDRGSTTVLERFTLDRMVSEIEDWLKVILSEDSLYRHYHPSCDHG